MAGLALRCPSCLVTDIDRFVCCERPLTVPSLEPVLPDSTWGHVLIGRRYFREVPSQLLERIGAGPSPLVSSEATDLFAACRVANGHLAWLWQADFDTLLGADAAGVRAQFAFAQSRGLVVELVTLPTGGVDELEARFEQLILLAQRTRSDEDPRLPFLAIVYSDVIRDSKREFQLEKYCAALAREFRVTHDVQSAVAYLVSRGPAPRSVATRPASSTHVRVLNVGGSLGCELLCELHRNTADGTPQSRFAADRKDIAGSQWRRLGPRPLPVTKGLDVPPWRGFRLALARNQPVVVELIDQEWLFEDDPSPLVVCLGERSAASELSFHCLLVRLSRFLLAPTVVVSSERSTNELVVWCRELFPSVPILRWTPGAAIGVLIAALRDVPQPPLFEIPSPPRWFPSWWPFGRRRHAA